MTIIVQQFNPLSTGVSLGNAVLSGTVAFDYALAGPWGGYCMRVNVTGTGTGGVMSGEFSGAGITGANAAATGHALGGFFFRYSTKPASNWEMIASTHISGGTPNHDHMICLNSSGQLEWRDRSGTLLDTGSTVLAANTWYYIEFKTDVTNQQAKVRIDAAGSDELDVTSGGPSTAGNQDGLILGKWADWNGNDVDFQYQHYWYAAGSVSFADAWQGRKYVGWLDTAGDGYQSDWTGDYTALDGEAYATDYDSSYVTSNVLNAISAFTFTTVASSGLDLSNGYLAARLTSLGRRQSAADAQGKFWIRTGGTNYYLSQDTWSNSASYEFHTNDIEINPATTNPWTVAELDAVQGVVEVVVSTNYLRLSSMWIAILGDKASAPITPQQRAYGPDGQRMNPTLRM